MERVANKVWFKQNKKFFELEKNKVSEEFPTLKFKKNNEVIHLTGPLQIATEIKGKNIEDEFIIDIEFPANFPAGTPTVKEVDGRKEKIVKALKLHNISDLHFNPNETACLTVDTGKYISKDNPTTSFIRNLVVPFFEGISYFEKYKKWPYGEYPHGAVGLLEFYSDEMGVANMGMLRELLIIIINGINPDSLCPCGSQKTIVKCHSQMLEGHKRLKQSITLEQFEYHLEVVEAHFSMLNKARKDAIRKIIKKGW